MRRVRLCVSGKWRDRAIVAGDCAAVSGEMAHSSLLVLLSIWRMAGLGTYGDDDSSRSGHGMRRRS